MIEMLRKLPDVLVGPVIAGGIWFGFNYVVLAERAMSADAREHVFPACMSALNDQQASINIPVIPNLFDRYTNEMPLLGEYQRLLEQAVQPKFLTSAQKIARCECAVMRSSSSKFDFAIHTASFRLIDADAVGGFRNRTVDFVLSGACGPLARGA